VSLASKLDSLTPDERRQLALRLSSAKRQAAAKKEARLPAVQPDLRNRFEPFQLTDLQQAYLIGRSEGIELGNISCHGYAEVDMEDWDRERFQTALQRIIDRHEMLRCIVLPEGRQQILTSGTQYEIKVTDLRKLDADAAAAQLDSIRARMSHQVHASDQWPLFEFCVSLLDSKISRLHISTDLLIADGRSFEIVFRELMQLYHHPETTLPPLELSFRDYLQALVSLEQTEVFRESREYWTGRVPSMPASPELPLEKNPSSVVRPVFKRRSACLEPGPWRNLKEKASRFHSTPVGTLLAAYAEVLAIWSKNPRFTLNLTLFNRLPLHPESNSIIGDFTSVNLLEVDNSSPPTFAARLQRQQERLWQDLDHRYFSGIQVMRELARFQRVGPTALMPVVFTSLLNLGEQDDGATWLSRLGKSVYAITQTPQVYLDCMVYEEHGSLRINWDAVEELFPAGLLDDMFEAFLRLLQDLAADDSSWQRPLAENARRLIPDAQMALRDAANNITAPLTSDLLHTSFLKQVAERPEQTAVCTPKRRLTYLEVYRYACRIEEELLRCELKPNEFVAVMMEKGWEQIVAVLGIHLAGAAYLPIDPELPAERQRYLLEHAKAKVALTQAAVRNRLSVPATVEVFEVDQLKPADTDAGPPADRRRQKPEDLAYVIYTSGSTGVPKGVMIDHRGALNTVLDINQRFGVGPQDRVLAVSRLSFDLSVYDVFGLLAAGGTIVMPAADLAYDANHWAELILQEKVTIWDTVPALMQLLVDQAGKPELLGNSLRLVMMSGDWIPLGLPDQIRRVLPKANVVSLGGATEASIWSILFPIGKVDSNWKSIPYGKAMLNQSFHVMKPDLGPCPAWVPGQLYIGGVGLAQGYLHDEQKTNASFIVNPANGERLYRTGDLGRFMGDGNIEFLGREDFQVKVQGYRIELGEIESRLQEYPGVDLCIVIVREDTPGEKRLAGYVVAKPGITIDPAEVRAYLRTKLPEYMVPAAIITLDRFPLTPNGKVDRKALPAPARSTAEAGSASVASRDSLDLQLIKLWEKVLNVRPIGLQDNFFDLGGNSLGAVRLFSEMRKLFGRSFSLSVLFQAPTVEKLADLIRKDGWTPTWTSLVPIQPRGAKPPFFCVHGGGGNVLIYRELARHLGPDYPFYGLQARGLDGSGDYLTTTETMAESYLREIRELQSEGPYYLGGFCMGGQVAVEIAQRLVRDGQQVNLLFVIDTHNFNGIPPQFTLMEKVGNLGLKIKFHSSNVFQLGLKSQLAYVKEKSKIAVRREIERLRIKVVHLFKLNPHRDVVRGTQEEFIEDINDRAFLAYKPTVYPGRMTICKPRRNYAFLRDPFNGWGGIAAGGLEVIDLPSDPGGIFTEPYVRTLAEKLREQIDQAVSPGAEIPDQPEPVLR
jgi:amino acid adenylation domain-containing protein